MNLDGYWAILELVWHHDFSTEMAVYKERNGIIDSFLILIITRIIITRKMGNSETPTYEEGIRMITQTW
jgi:hypothetical protein